MPAPHVSDYEAFICENPRCGERLPVPPGADMTISEWRHSPEVEKWMAEHRQHAGCTGISLMPNAPGRIEQINPDMMALRILRTLSVVDDEWQAQPVDRLEAEKQLRLVKLITEWKTYLAGSKGE